MKILVKLFLIFTLLISTAKAATFDVLVIPADIFNTKENYYNFDEVSEIVANDIIKDFNKTGKIISPDLYTVRAKFNQNQNLNQIAKKSISKYQSSGNIDYNAFKQIGEEFGCKSVLLVSGYAVTNKNSLKRSVWEVLEISTDFNIIYPFRLETSILLLDTVNNLIMWSNNYSYKLGANDNIFAAKNYAQANAEYEKIKMYSKNVVAPSAAQNITLRFFPKTISPIKTEVQDTGGALRFDRSLPEHPSNKEKDIVPYTGDLFFDY